MTRLQSITRETFIYENDMWLLEELNKVTSFYLVLLYESNM